MTPKKRGTKLKIDQLKTIGENFNSVSSFANHNMLMMLKVMNAESSRKCAKTKINRVHFAGGSKHGDLGF